MVGFVENRGTQIQLDFEVFIPSVGWHRNTPTYNTFSKVLIKRSQNHEFDSPLWGGGLITIQYMPPIV